jgi:hypothetical protein
MYKRTSTPTGVTEVGIGMKLAIHTPRLNIGRATKLLLVCPRTPEVAVPLGSGVWRRCGNGSGGQGQDGDEELTSC